MIVVCDNTDIAQVFFEKISGERVIDIEEPAGEGTKTRKTKQTVYEGGQVFPEFSNSGRFRPTLRIDTKLLEQVESDDPAMNKSQAAEELRETIAHIGKPGTRGQHVRCVVSVQMLTEGWDANNVTHILGLRAFSSQLLCEQVVGRGLRRMDYTPDPETGLLPEEYVDVYGIPFSIIPFRGRSVNKPAPEDKPKNEVKALVERKHFEMRFPIVEGYAFALNQHLIRADIDGMEPLVIEPDRTPTAVYVKPQVGIQMGGGSPFIGGFEVIEENRSQYYEAYHIQTIKFEIARRVIRKLSEDVTGDALPKMRYQSRQQLFPQVLQLVNAFVAKKVDWRGEHPSELGLEKYVIRTVDRLVDAIAPNENAGETPLLPILNRYKPIGSTQEVYFKTTRPVQATVKSHINQVVLDTSTWERSAAFRLERSAAVLSYARNDHLEFTIPYEYQGVSHNFVPVVLEIKGFQDDRVRAKHQAAKKWVQAINNWGKLGRWHFHVCTDPQLLDREMTWLLGQSSDATVTLADIPEIAADSPLMIDVESLPLFQPLAEELGVKAEKEHAVATLPPAMEPAALPMSVALTPKQVVIVQDDTGYSYENLFGDYLKGARKIILVDPYIRLYYQFRNLVRFMDVLHPPVLGSLDFHLVTGADSLEHEVELSERFDMLQGQLFPKRIRFTYTFDKHAHDRWIETDTAWRIILGRGLDFFQKPTDRYAPDWNDYTLRKCKATTIVFMPHHRSAVSTGVAR